MSAVMLNYVLAESQCIIYEVLLIKFEFSVRMQGLGKISLEARNVHMQKTINYFSNLFAKYLSFHSQCIERFLYVQNVKTTASQRFLLITPNLTIIFF